MHSGPVGRSCWLLFYLVIEFSIVYWNLKNLRERKMPLSDRTNILLNKENLAPRSQIKENLYAKMQQPMKQSISEIQAAVS